MLFVDYDYTVILYSFAEIKSFNVLSPMLLDNQAAKASDLIHFSSTKHQITRHNGRI